ncbi:MAG TPA: riboflavin synthase [Candidatus Limnocylindrales bacterium]|nr:riboflavin synthase [Candidatus Limnocylindrales bacterium]
MFTGIIEDLGRLAARQPLAAGQRLRIATHLSTSDFQLGESIALSGACMTVVEWSAGEFAVDVSAESLRRTTLGALAEGEPINIERSMKLGDRLGGHIVSGHVDGTGTVVAIREEGESAIFTFAIDEGLMPMLVEKGSVAVDGISLTCFHCGTDRFDVAVIPHTRQVTTLGARRVGDRVNIETDVLGKYVARLVEASVRAHTR